MPPPFNWALLRMKFELSICTEEPSKTSMPPPDWFARLFSTVQEIIVKCAAPTRIAPSRWSRSVVCESTTIPPVIKSPRPLVGARSLDESRLAATSIVHP
eukprot:5813871-Prymnesium_polylepis.1